MPSRKMREISRHLCEGQAKATNKQILQGEIRSIYPGTRPKIPLAWSLKLVSLIQFFMLRCARSDLRGDEQVAVDLR